MIFGARGLAQRRRALVERSAAQRRALLAAGAPLAAKAAAAERLLAAVRSSWPWVVRAATVYTLLKRGDSTRSRSLARRGAESAPHE